MCLINEKAACKGGFFIDFYLHLALLTLS